jgi:hypothetical protein
MNRQVVDSNSSAAVVWPISRWIQVHKLVLASGVPNAFGCKIRIPTNLNVDYWENNLVDYCDKEVVQYLKYGWPLNVSTRPSNHMVPHNHRSAIDNPEHVKKFLNKAFALDSMLGPFKKNPFSSPACFSPIGMVEKNDSSDRRLILDMSFPGGFSVNDVIPKGEYLGKRVSLRYPGIDELVNLIKLKGRGCAIFKKDLKSAYRQLLRIDPADIPLLGLCWEGDMLFDLTQPQGSRSAALCCQRSSSALMHIFKLKSDCTGVNYLDDLAVAEVWSKVWSAYETLGKVIEDSGLKESVNKDCPPDVKMVFLGVLVDTLNMTLSVTPERLSELRILIKDWLAMLAATRKQLQSLVGKLSFVAACVRPGRTFLARLFSVMRITPDCGCHPIPDTVYKDLIWWNTFLPLYNGVSMMVMDEWSCPDEIFSSDACMTGCRAWLFESREYFKAKFPESILHRTKHINQLELLTMTVACRIWGDKWRGKRILAKCDNDASVGVVNSGRSKGDEFMMSCARDIAYHAATKESEFRVIHIEGKKNGISDTLSRWHDIDNPMSKLHSLVGPEPILEIIIDDALFEFIGLW